MLFFSSFERKKSSLVSPLPKKANSYSVKTTIQHLLDGHRHQGRAQLRPVHATETNYWERGRGGGGGKEAKGRHYASGVKQSQS